MKTRSWEAFFEKLHNIKDIINNSNKCLSFDEFKHKISKELDINGCKSNLKQLSNNFYEFFFYD